MKKFNIFFKTDNEWETIDETMYASILEQIRIKENFINVNGKLYSVWEIKKVVPL